MSLFKTIIENPLYTFILGFVFAILLVKYLFILIAMISIFIITLVLFRETMIPKIKKELRAVMRKDNHLKPCEECGSKTKHFKTCSKYTKKGDDKTHE